MAIRKFPCLFFLLMIFFPSPANAQNDGSSPNSPFKPNTYGISWVVPSEDRKFLTFQKAYEYSSDTLALVSTANPEKILYQTPGIFPISVKYTKKGSVFMSGATKARLVNLTTLQEKIWEGFKNALYMEWNDTIAFLKDDTLQFLSQEGQTLEEIPGVISIQVTDQRLFYTQRTAEGFKLQEWTPEKKHILYEGKTEGYNVDYCNGPVVIFHKTEYHPGESHIYLTNEMKNETLPFPSYMGETRSAVQFVSALKSGRYFITFNTENKKTPQSSDVDIWYGNDRRLENKFYNDLILTYAVWTPGTREIKQLDHIRFPKHIDTGEGRYLLAYDPMENQDYVKERIRQKVYRYDTELDRYEELGDTGINMITGKDGRFLLSHDTEKWVVYDITTKSKRTVPFPDRLEYNEIYFSSDGDHILFPGNGKVSEYGVKTGVMRHTLLPASYSAEIAGGTSEELPSGARAAKNFYDASVPLLMKISDSKTSYQTLGIYNNRQFKLLFPAGPEFITPLTSFSKQEGYLYLKQNYNVPPVIMIHRDQKERVIYRSNPQDKVVSKIRMDKISYTNSKGVALQGLLYYPVNYDASKKYPMVVGIYEIMHNYGNRYLRDGFSKVEGISYRDYLERGYFIYLPDIVYDGRGTGRSALDCVESSIAALKDNHSIDFARVGLAGHSHGGYETNFIATQSKKFAAYVGGAGNSDLVRSYHSFNYDYFRPFYWQFEEQQYRMFRSFAEDKNLYIDNSPVYHAEKVTRPILLWTGTNDQNIYWEQTMEYYLALRRNHKKVIALFYDKEDHSFLNRANREDLFVKISAWFDYQLKDIKKDWIDVMQQ
ncbi:S9 family peptidase [Chryseobacterium sp. MDT2-18]|uniref:alpha/beta hydrolase family protein n=1 Tax=Chryseobacterium sp. MDT2-18 TaxID=1259136 RepID=UPI002784B41D|nr:prolyl oligopeptidase family serine peptidase [Chryseobacterium sp. MDT2-18]MDQ0477463.1 dienelactone hydrolase [Chryseobacterium sp. MDT2-18]